MTNTRLHRVTGRTGRGTRAPAGRNGRESVSAAVDAVTRPLGAAQAGGNRDTGGSGLVVPAAGTLIPGRPGDQEEQWADRLAGRALHSAGDRGNAETGGRQRLSSPSYVATPAADALRHQLEQGPDRGVPLSDELRAWLEPRLGYDLERIRIHTGGEPAGTAERFGSSAFAFGPHLVFAPGQFRPDTPQGRHLLAHEVAHAIRQLTPGGGQAVVQRDVPMGTVITSEGEQQIEGMEVTSSASDLQMRLLTGEPMINERIDGWVRENVSYVASSLESAAESFENWYTAHASSSSSSFVYDVVAAGLGILSAAYPPAGLAAAVLGGVLSVTRSAASARDAARSRSRGSAAVQVEQAMINKAVELRGSWRGFGSRLKARGDAGERVWSNVGLALTMNDPNMVPIAREELYTGARLAPLEQDFTRQALTAMILTYNHWERVNSLENTWLFVSSRDIEWAIMSDAERRRWASRQARSQLSITDESLR